MNIQIFGTKKNFDSKKAERYFKERGIKYQSIIKVPVVRNGKQATVGYQPEIWKSWK